MRAPAVPLRQECPVKPFGQRAGSSEITELPQDPGEVVQGGADGGVLGPVRGFVEGQSTFPHRFDHYNCIAMLETEDHADVESGTAWSRKCYEAMRVPSPSAPPTSTTSARSASICRKRTGPAWSDCALKTEYDPTDFFRLNQLIKATAA